MGFAYFSGVMFWKCFGLLLILVVILYLLCCFEVLLPVILCDFTIVTLCLLLFTDIHSGLIAFAS